MYKLNIQSSNKDIAPTKLEYRDLQKAKADGQHLQERTPEHTHYITSDGIRIWDADKGDNANILTL